VFWYSLGEFRHAISVADAHTRPDPFYPGLLAGWKGWAFYFLKEYDQALPLLRECVLQMPKLDGRTRMASSIAGTVRPSG
jgi:hypothetical protein